ncbi:hypothetical protein TIFTF001_036031 [Ficus carica]|uniref:Retrotransposon gag domain-containing protein n=1 Tax=Ficus carica TaxID=3494 RepID=A0AA88JAS8_FICCA|nr:hypothetical protein TIFTF001_036031 [Ficus carica]
MDAHHVVLDERKLTTYVYAVVTTYVRWVVIELVSERVPVFWSHSLPASATVIPVIPRDRGTWADFHALIIARFRLFPDEDADMFYRDPEIYHNMYLRRYLSYVADWRAYPNKSMGHYCQRFRDAMLPHIPRDLGDPEMQALHLLRGRLPPNVRLFVLEPMAGMTLEDMMRDIMEAEIIAHMMQVATMEDDYVVPVDDAGIAEPLFHGGPVMPEDPIPAMPLQVIPPQEVEADAEDDEMDPVDVPIDQEENPEDPPIIIIESDDEEEVEEEQEEWEEQEEAIEEEWEGLEEPENLKMVRPHVRVSKISQKLNLANIVATLQQQLLEQQQETNRLREQIARMNQVPRANEVPPQEIPVPPVAPQAPGIRQKVPRNVEVPLAPAGIQINPPVVREDLLYERFRRMKAPEFEGPTDLIEDDNWLIDIQVILDFMGLTEHEKVLCASFALKKDARYWWMTVQMRRDVTAMSC